MKRYVTLAALAALAACDAPGGLEAPPAPSAERVGRPDIIVHAGSSIQAAVDAAGPGTVIQIEPGTYAEAIHISVPHLALVGQRGRDGAGVVIENPGGQDNGIGVDQGSDGFVLLNVTVRGFGENVVLLSGVNGFLISEVTAQDNGEYGLFPVHSSHGVIERCRASGHNDTGIYVGQSHDVIVRHSVAFGNVNGIEFENSQRVRGVANETYDNVVGILVVVLPGLDVKTTSDVLVAGNRVHDNNHPNFAPPGDLASLVPTGTGILIHCRLARVDRVQSVPRSQLTASPDRAAGPRAARPDRRSRSASRMIYRHGSRWCCLAAPSRPARCRAATARARRPARAAR